MGYSSKEMKAVLDTSPPRGWMNQSLQPMESAWTPIEGQMNSSKEQCSNSVQWGITSF